MPQIPDVVTAVPERATRARRCLSVAQAFLPVPTQHYVSILNPWRISRHRSSPSVAQAPPVRRS
jgi:hypothetical protein